MQSLFRAALLTAGIFLSGVAAAAPMPPPVSFGAVSSGDDVVLVRGGHGHGHMGRGGRGHHYGWSRGRHRGWR